MKPARSCIFGALGAAAAVMASAAPASAGGVVVKSVAAAGHGHAAVVAVAGHAHGRHHRHPRFHGHGHHRHHGHHHHYHHHHHSGAYTLLGFGLGLLAYDLAHKKSRRVETVPVYAPPPPAPDAVSGATGRPDSSCLQVREYQTTITVGGEEREAYGDACLMPDGNWRLGPPKLVPQS